jgi:hypothetical protein
LVYTEDMVDTTTHQPEPSKRQSEPAEQTDQEPKARKQIPLVSVPNDRDMMAEEMAELFDEDKVTHKHGSSEPEAD